MVDTYTFTDKQRRQIAEILVQCCINNWDVVQLRDALKEVTSEVYWHPAVVECIHYLSEILITSAILELVED